MSESFCEQGRELQTNEYPKYDVYVNVYISERENYTLNIL